MQKFIFIFIFCVSSCKAVQIPHSEISLDNVRINLRVKNCIDIYKKDTVTFIIHNGNNKGFWINAWNLRLDSIVTKNAEVVSSKSLVAYRRPDLPEFTWVDAYSEIRISYQTDFFFRASLKRLEKYCVYSSYRKFTYRQKIKFKENILVNHINIDSVNFWTCPYPAPDARLQFVD